MIRRNWRLIFIILSLLVDSLAIAMAAVLSFFVRDILLNLPRYSPFIFFVTTAVMGGILLVVALIIGLYRASYRTTLRKQYKIALKAYLYAIPTIFMLFYFVQWPQFPRRFSAIFFLLLPIAFVFGRNLLNAFNVAMQRRGYGVQKALVYGYDDGWLEVFQRFTVFPELGYEIKGAIASPTRVRTGTEVRTNGTTVPLYASHYFPKLVEEHQIDEVFILSPKLVSNGSAELLDFCKLNRIRLKVLSPEAEGLLHMMHLHDLAGITLYAPRRTRIELVRKIAKRCFDIMGSLALLFLLSPIFLLTAFAIWVESGRPVIFKQKRSSVKDGKTFEFYKFRSMVQDADHQKESLLVQNEADGALFKIKNDPRLTRVGRFIRRYSIDELPQLLNVLKGEMSLVGPRPLPVEDFNRLNEGPEFWEAVNGRQHVLPGMTGLWQISGRSGVGFKEMLLLDYYYIENQSLLFDLEILFATIPVVLFGKGAY